MCIFCAIVVVESLAKSLYVCCTINTQDIMKNVNRFIFCAIFFALFLVQSVFGDIIPTEGAFLSLIHVIVPLTQTVLQLYQSKETSFP